jgi:ketosteroid isomerase-like protein
VTSNAERAAVLVRALRARVDDVDDFSDLYTDDVTLWTPSLTAASRDELRQEFDRRDDAFSDFALDVTPLDVGGDYASAEWEVSMTHSGALAVADGAVVEPTGLRVTLHGVTVAEFRDGRICSLRQYWDELSLFEQLGLFT